MLNAVIKFWPPLSYFICLLLAVGLTACDQNDGVTAQSSERKAKKSINYASNGHAENGTKFWGAHGSARISISDTTAHSGMFSVYVGNRSDAWHGVTYKFQDVRPNRTYEISVWVKLAPGELDSEVMLTARFDGKEPIYRNLVSVTANSRQWTQIKGQFDHPNSKLDYVYIESPNPQLSYYVDDINLKLAGSDTDLGEQEIEETSVRPAGQARFNWFEYVGKDAQFNEPLKDGQFRNPILAGFRAEPSITRVGDDYYLVHSSYVYWPGIPIYHSRDLVSWRQLGYVITHQTQFNFDDRQVSEGIIAPSIRYHNGTFYVIATASWAGGHFLVTAKDPSGPWSSPVFFQDIKGIDPDLFFDDNGRVYIVNNSNPDAYPYYSGHRAIWLHEYDLDNHTIKPGTSRVIVNGGVDITKKPVWIQGPHLFKKDGWYYLTCAQGGNGMRHSQVIFRAKTLQSTFEPGPINPILSQHGLPEERENPIISAGHADMLQTSNGNWWAVFMASRAYDKTYFNVGRETFLLPVTWRDGWPLILEEGAAIPSVLDKPQLDTTPPSVPLKETGNFSWRDDFDSTHLKLGWQSLRQPAKRWLTIDSINQQLIIASQKDSLASLRTPAFISRILQHHEYEVSTELVIPDKTGISAGIAAIQNSRYHYYLGVRESGEGKHIFVEKASGGDPEVIQIEKLETQENVITLGIQGKYGEISFFYQLPGKERQLLLEKADGTILSSSVSREVVGTRIGPYVRPE